MGVIADHTASRRGPLLVGLLALGASTALLCVGTSVPVLVLGRILQGVSAALVWTVGVALLVDTVEKDAVGQAVGYITLGMTAGTVLGPLLGGVVYDAGGYYAVFIMAFAVIAVDILLRFVMIEKKIAAKWGIGHQSSDYGTIKGQCSPLLPESEEEQQQQQSENGDLDRPQPKNKSVLNRLPPILRLLTYPRLLLNLLACFVTSALLISFDGVRKPHIHLHTQ